MKNGLPYAEDAKVTQKTQKKSKDFFFVFFCVLCVPLRTGVRIKTVE
jgi:hypothetical protein